MNPADAQAMEEAYDVCVIGLGYVGLPTAAVLATNGFRVCGVDIRPEVVDTVNAGGIHIVEPELDALVRAAVQAGTLRATNHPARASTYLICVPTPLDADHQPGLDYVRAAAEALAPVVSKGDLVVLESTSPPGTTRNVVAPPLRARGLEPGVDVFVAHAPERVLPGAVLREVVENPRVVGGLTETCTERAARFYERFVRAEVHQTSSECAELAKLTENAFRDVNIAFANELMNVCDKLGLDGREVIALANHHPRVNILRPGPGVGGHCIAVDPWFIAAVAPDVTPLIRAARQVNDARPAQVVDQVCQLAARFKSPTIACLGLAYKPDIDDLRESPAVEVVKMLRDRRVGELRVCEPNVEKSEIEGIPLVGLEAALDGADIVVILVAHRAFRRIRKDLLARAAVVDTVGLT